MGRLDGKVAVITGGAGVIGSTAGKLFAKVRCKSCSGGHVRRQFEEGS